MKHLLNPLGYLDIAPSAIAFFPVLIHYCGARKESGEVWLADLGFAAKMRPVR
ncbi:hypothetical protein [Nostoc sp. JL33]|uniref:hypothetical protein n=1 Tax=Nostoc sp. JL33 TaxID=2815396 RepID=UPI0025CC84D2|nr:hypothetical protein [Nostoc sp. JL33]MBN3874173.1 hypothetical protein [Nostoc sp. JL33]